MTTRRTVLGAITAAAAAAQAQRRYPNWKPQLGVLCQYSDANLEFVKAEGFTSMQLRLDPAKLDDAAIAAIKDKIASAPGFTCRSLAWTATTSTPTPASAGKNQPVHGLLHRTCGKLGIPPSADRSGTMRGQPLPEQVD